MRFRIFPLWWPLMIIVAPILIPMLLIKNKRYKKNLVRVEQVNRKRMEQAKPLDLPELKFLDLTVLVEEKTKEGFLGAPGVSYLFESDRGSLLFDVSFGPQYKTLGHNASKLGITFDRIDALAISHLHPDHMGGVKATRKKDVAVAKELGSPAGKTCFLPDSADASGFSKEIVVEPQMLTAGIASTGPLARSLFLFGYCEEQVLIARIKGKGLVVFTGCGHPTIEVIIEMVRCLSDEPIYAIGGGLHFPITRGRGKYLGIQLQMIAGTGIPPWKRLDDGDLTKTITAINEAKPKKVYLSAHDTCDHALNRLENELKAETEVLKAGATYKF